MRAVVRNQLKSASRALGDRAGDGKPEPDTPGVSRPRRVAPIEADNFESDSENGATYEVEVTKPNGDGEG